MFHLLLCVTENIKQSHAVRGGRFRIEFQLGQGNLMHMHGDRLRFRPRYFSPFFPVRGSGTPSPTTESDHSAPVRPDKIKTYFYQRLTKWATHRDLNHFNYTSEVSQLHNTAHCPNILAEGKVSQILYAHERQKTTRLLPFLVSGATSR